MIAMGISAPLHAGLPLINMHLDALQILRRIEACLLEVIQQPLYRRDSTVDRRRLLVPADREEEERE